MSVCGIVFVAVDLRSILIGVDGSGGDVIDGGYVSSVEGINRLPLQW